ELFRDLAYGRRAGVARLGGRVLQAYRASMRRRDEARMMGTEGTVSDEARRPCGRKQRNRCGDLGYSRRIIRSSHPPSASRACVAKSSAFMKPTTRKLARSAPLS